MELNGKERDRERERERERELRKSLIAGPHRFQLGMSPFLLTNADCGGVPKSHLSLWDLYTTVSVKPSHRGTGNGLQECNDKKREISTMKKKNKGAE